MNIELRDVQIGQGQIAPQTALMHAIVREIGDVQ